MVHERSDKFEDDEESEYHFSDDQVNYEMESDASKPGATVASKNIKETLVDAFNKHRRTILSAIGFFILIFIVYKMLSPTSTQPTEISQATAVTQPVVKAAPTQEVVQQVPSPVPTNPSEQQQQAPTMQPPVQMPPPPQNMNVSAGQPSTMMQPQNQMPLPAPQQQQYPVPPPQQVLPPASQVMPAPTNAPPVAEMQTAEQKNIVDRLAALEEQNAKLMNLLQTQFAQKIADYEAQTKSVQDRVVILNKRLSNIEASMNKMAQLLQEEGPKAPMKVGGRPPAPGSAEPKMSYTVQAIIPGRAWLKSDAGDTVTVAENDLLKDYGRVVKIDPYDGIVEIDTGSRVIALSYGSGGD